MNGFVGEGQESMRLTPTVAGAIPREAMCNICINGHFFPKGTLIFSAIQGTHLHPDNWDRPNDFIPVSSSLLFIRSFLFFSVLFFSVIFFSVLFCSVLFFSVLFFLFSLVVVFYFLLLFPFPRTTSQG